MADRKVVSTVVANFLYIVDSPRKTKTNGKYSVFKRNVLDKCFSGVIVLDLL